MPAMDSRHFTRQLEMQPEGTKGILYERAIPLSEVRASGGGALTTSSTPSSELLDTNGFLALEYADTEAALICLTIPFDYDESEDELRLVFTARASTTAVTSFDIAGKRLQIGDTASEALAFTGGASFNKTGPTGTTAIEIDAEISGSTNGKQSFKAGDIVTLLLTGNTNGGADTLQAGGLRMRYRSTLVAFAVDDRE